MDFYEREREYLNWAIDKLAKLNRNIAQQNMIIIHYAKKYIFKNRWLSYQNTHQR